MFRYVMRNRSFIYLCASTAFAAFNMYGSEAMWKLNIAVLMLALSVLSKPTGWGD